MIEPGLEDLGNTGYFPVSRFGSRIVALKFPVRMNREFGR